MRSGCYLLAEATTPDASACMVAADTRDDAHTALWVLLPLLLARCVGRFKRATLRCFSRVARMAWRVLRLLLLASWLQRKEHLGNKATYDGHHKRGCASICKAAGVACPQLKHGD